MTQEQRETLQDLFAHEGWKMIVKELQDTRKMTLEACPSGAVSNDQWQFARGQLFQMDSFINLEAFMEHAWEQADQAAREEEEESVADPF